MTQIQAELDHTISYMRQRDFFDPAKYPESKVTLVGCGGIGSFTGVALAKLGIQYFTLIDPDVVEPHNIPNQLYAHTIGSDVAKVMALKQQMVAFGAPQNIITRQTLFQATTRGLFTGGPVIAALDSMEARTELWHTIVKGNHGVPLFIDARLGAFNIRVFNIDPTSAEDQEYYEATLHTDAEASEDSCTGRAIIDVGFLVSSLITRSVRRFYTATESSRSMPEREIYFNADTLHVMKG